MRNQRNTKAGSGEQLAGIAPRASKSPAPASKKKRGAPRRGKSTITGLQSAISAYHEEILCQNEQLMQAHTELERSRDRYARLYDEAPVGYVTLDRNGVIEDANLTAATLFGASRTVLVGRPLLTFIHGEDRSAFLNFMLKCRNDPANQRHWTELRLGPRKSNEETQVQLSSAGVSRDSGKGAVYLTAITDVTGRVALERRRRAAELRTAEALRQSAVAQAASDAKDRFLAMLSHELRTPLTPALMRLSALPEDPAVAPALRDELRLVRNDIELEARLIDDLLDINRILHGKFEPNFELLNLRDILGHSVRTCEPDIRAGNLTLEPFIRGDPIPVNGDPVRLQQVFWNILRNAVKFTPSGGTITIEAGISGAAARVRITDTGAGIEPQLLPMIYNAFEQGGAFVTRRHGGLGLGLAISKAIIQAHSGAIIAQSDGQNRGTCFTVTLPLSSRSAPVAQNSNGAPLVAQNSNGAPPVAQNSNGASRARGPRAAALRILLVEDHDVTRHAMSKILASLGYEICSAANAQQALEAAAARPFDLVISDLGLPDRSGYELMEELRRLHKLRGIALSGFGMEKDRDRSRQSGFAVHMTKPVTIQALQQAIDRLATGKVDDASSPPAAPGAAEPSPDAPDSQSLATFSAALSPGAPSAPSSR